MLKQSIFVEALEKAVGKVINSSAFGEGFFALVQGSEGLELVAAVQGSSPLEQRWQAKKSLEQDGLKIYLLNMNANNWALVRRYIKWTAPSACGAKGISIGIKAVENVDRGALLGLCQNRMIKPVLADAAPVALEKAKKNFLNLTDEATQAVFTANWRNGYGANASGLTTEEEIVKALLYGYSMVGFDPSGKIVSRNIKATDSSIEKKFSKFPQEFQDALKASYLGVEFQVGRHKISFSADEMHRIVLEFGEVIMHTQFIYNSYLKSTPWPIDFELDIHRPDRPLTPKEHYLIANELERNGVKITSFLFDCKDNIQDEDLELHAEIATTFEYRLALDNSDLANNDWEAFLKAARNKAHFKVQDIAGAQKLLSKGI